MQRWGQPIWHTSWSPLTSSQLELHNPVPGSIRIKSNTCYWQNKTHEFCGLVNVFVPLGRARLVVWEHQYSYWCWADSSWLGHCCSWTPETSVCFSSQSNCECRSSAAEKGKLQQKICSQAAKTIVWQQFYSQATISEAGQTGREKKVCESDLLWSHSKTFHSLTVPFQSI